MDHQNHLSNISKLTRPLGGSKLNLSRNAGILLNVSETLLRECFLDFILWQKSPQSLRSSGSLRVILMGEKSHPFSNSFVLILRIYD